MVYNDKTLRLCKKSTGSQLKTFEVHQDYVWSLANSPYGNKKWLWWWWNVKIIGESDSISFKNIRSSLDYVLLVAFLPDGNGIVNCSNDKT